MKLSEVKDYEYVPNQVDFTNFFNVEERVAKNGSVETFFNLNDGVVVDGASDVSSYDGLKMYTCRSGDNLRFISHREYGTVRYWWLIAKINGIMDAFEEIHCGRKLYLLSKEYMNYVINVIMEKK